MNDEKGLANIELKRDRMSTGGPFELPYMIVTNKTIGQHFLTPDIHRVVNIGSGAGTFEWINAPLNPCIQFLAVEMDEKTTEWTKENRPLNNVQYSAKCMKDILKEETKFDLAVTIDVIEHVADYKSFLEDFCQLADKAVIATPNRDRHYTEIRKPHYEYHVQEFDAGELYFILKMFYRKVELYSAKDDYDPHLFPVGLYSSYGKLFAYCER